MLIRLKKAQGVTEYAIFIAAVLAGFIALQIYFQRAVKGNLKQRSDALGEQFTTTQDYTIQRTTQTDRESYTGYWDDGFNVYTSKSTILHDLEDTGFGGGSFEADLENAGAKLLEDRGYAHHEVSTGDYVDATQGGGDMGTHSSMPSGKIATISPWEDAGIQ